MIISCIGDSLTEGDYGIFGKRGIKNVKDENYPYFLSKIMDCEVRNFGKCGYTSTIYLEKYDENNIDITGSDAVIIMLGTNGGLDKNDPNAIGNRDYAALVEFCSKAAKNAVIILCTPPHVTENMNLSGFGCAERVYKAQEFVREFAQKHKLPLIDTALCTDFRAETEEIMQSNDGVHFSRDGYLALAKYIAAQLRNIIIEAENS